MPPRKRIKRKATRVESEIFPAGGKVNVPEGTITVPPGYYVLYQDDLITGVLNPDDYALLFEEDVQ